MENPITNLETQPETINQQCDQQDDQNSGVVEVSLSKSSENVNQHDNKPDTESRSQLSPQQENEAHIEISASQQGNEEENQQTNQNSSQEDRIEDDAVQAVSVSEQIGENKTEFQIKLMQQVADSKEQANNQPGEAQEGDTIASSSANENDAPLIRVESASPEVNEDPNKIESPGYSSKLKERSPQLKLLIVTNPALQQDAPLGSPTAENDSTSNFAQGTIQDLEDSTTPGIKKARTNLAVEEPTESPDVKKTVSATNLGKEEENKNEPPSASQPGQKARLSLEDFHKITSVGKGSYGEVFLVKKISNNKLYALKAIDKNFMKKVKGRLNFRKD